MSESTGSFLTKNTVLEVSEWVKSRESSWACGWQRQPNLRRIPWLCYGVALANELAAVRAGRECVRQSSEQPRK